MGIDKLGVARPSLNTKVVPGFDGNESLNSNGFVTTRTRKSLYASSPRILSIEIIEKFSESRDKVGERFRPF